MAPTTRLPKPEKKDRHFYIPVSILASILLFIYLLDHPFSPVLSAGLSFEPALLARSAWVGGRTDPPEGVDLRRAARALMPEAAALLDGEHTRWDADRAAPCFRPDGPGGALHCLPAFYVLGAFHSGALDLWSRISAHPQVESAVPGTTQLFFSEVHSWDTAHWRGCDFGSCPAGRGAAAVGGVAPTPRMVADPSVVWGEAAGGSFTFTWSHTHSLLHDAWYANTTACWAQGPEWQGDHYARCFAPALQRQREHDESIGAGSHGEFQIPWVMRAAHGDKIRLLALLRNPVERAHSAYWYWPQYRRLPGGATPEGFLAYLQLALPPLQHCIAAHGLYACAVRFEALDMRYEGVFYHADQLLKGLYVAYLPAWIAAFGKERILIGRSEDYFQRPRPVLEAAFPFLGLRDPSEAEWDAILAAPVAVLPGSEHGPGPCGTCGDFSLLNTRAQLGGSGRVTRIQAPMLPEARRLLEQFYAPYNQQLADILGDDAFLWGAARVDEEEELMKKKDDQRSSGQ